MNLKLRFLYTKSAIELGRPIHQFYIFIYHLLLFRRKKVNKAYFFIIKQRLNIKDDFE